MPAKLKDAPIPGSMPRPHRPTGLAPRQEREFINWGKLYIVNVRELDEEHKALFAIINRLHAAMAEGKGSGVMEAILAELISYTEYHFAHEERLMRQYDYPEYPAHLDQHAALIHQVMDFKRRFAMGKILLSVGLLRFLKNWACEHILQQDMSYRLFFNLKGIN